MSPFRFVDCPLLASRRDAESKPTPCCIIFMWGETCEAESVGYLVLTSNKMNKRQWCSGNITAFQAVALSSILGWRNVFFCISNLL